MTAPRPLAPPSGAKPLPRWLRLPLAKKFAVAFVGLVSLVLLINGAVDLTLNYYDAKRTAIARNSGTWRRAKPLPSRHNMRTRSPVGRSSDRVRRGLRGSRCDRVFPHPVRRAISQKKG